MYRIFVVEDDRALGEAIKTQLSGWGNEVTLARDFRNILGEFSACSPQLVLLDIMLPFMNGYHWCSEIRKQSKVPVIFISSASDNLNIVTALTMGADDFIAKPVDSMVLCAKVQALLRRTYEINGSGMEISFRGAMLNIDDFSVTNGNMRVELTRNEFRILETLLNRPGAIVSRDALMNALWQDDCYVEENTLTVNVARLRRKLSECGLENVIVTKPGSGYMLVC